MTKEELIEMLREGFQLRVRADPAFGMYGSPKLDITVSLVAVDQDGFDDIVLTDTQRIDLPETGA